MSASALWTKFDPKLAFLKKHAVPVVKKQVHVDPQVRMDILLGNAIPAFGEMFAPGHWRNVEWFHIAELGIQYLHQQLKVKSLPFGMIPGAKSKFLLNQNEVGLFVYILPAEVMSFEIKLIKWTHDFYSRPDGRRDVEVELQTPDSFQKAIKSAREKPMVNDLTLEIQRRVQSAGLERIFIFNFVDKPAAMNAALDVFKSFSNIDTNIIQFYPTVRRESMSEVFMDFGPATVVTKDINKGMFRSILRAFSDWKLS